jgi:hypothetical protein
MSNVSRKSWRNILFFIISVLVLLPNFYRNWWCVVDSAYYTDWQTRYDRLVVARLVKTRQDGFFSAGGLMGLGDVTGIGYESRINRHQFNTYFDNEKFRSYYVYKSNPGLQTILYGLFDKAFPVSGEQKLKILRGFTALLTAIVFGLIIAFFAIEFGFLAGILTLAFTLVSMWIVLPAGSIFWDYWAFYAPFLASGYVLADAEKNGGYRARKIRIIMYAAMLIKVLFSGFDLTTTVLVMATVPFVFYAIYQHWDIKTFLERTVKAGIALLAATITGLLVLGAQIIAEAGSISFAYTYLVNRFTSHTGGDYEYFDQSVPVRKIGVMEVLPKYLLMPAIDIPRFGIQIRYWHLIVVFAAFTLILLLRYRIQADHLQLPRKAIALLAATWYSILAPISWYVTFRPHSFIHTHVNTMGWQMPFTLLGFALCGFVITDLFTSEQRIAVSVPPVPSSQTD